MQEMSFNCRLPKHPSQSSSKLTQRPWREENAMPKCQRHCTEGKFYAALILSEKIKSIEFTFVEKSNCNGNNPMFVFYFLYGIIKRWTFHMIRILPKKKKNHKLWNCNIYFVIKDRTTLLSLLVSLSFKIGQHYYH